MRERELITAYIVYEDFANLTFTIAFNLETQTKKLFGASDEKVN
jgi:hypothetical protein